MDHDRHRWRPIRDWCFDENKNYSNFNHFELEIRWRLFSIFLTAQYVIRVKKKKLIIINVKVTFEIIEILVQECHKYLINSILRVRCNIIGVWPDFRFFFVPDFISITLKIDGDTRNWEGRNSEISQAYHPLVYERVCVIRSYRITEGLPEGDLKDVNRRVSKKDSPPPQSRYRMLGRGYSRSTLWVSNYQAGDRLSSVHVHFWIRKVRKDGRTKLQKFKIENPRSLLITLIYIFKIFVGFYIICFYKFVRICFALARYLLILLLEFVIDRYTRSRWAQGTPLWVCNTKHIRRHPTPRELRCGYISRCTRDRR